MKFPPFFLKNISESRFVSFKFRFPNFLCTRTHTQSFCSCEKRTKKCLETAANTSYSIFRSLRTNFCRKKNPKKLSIKKVIYTPLFRWEKTKTSTSLTMLTDFSLLQLAELEQRVVEAESRAEDAEDKVSVKV